MRVLFAHSFYRIPGGEDRHVREQVDLVSRFHKVALISESNASLTKAPRTVARMLYSPAKARGVGATIDAFGPDVVHVHNVYPALGPAVLKAAEARRIPVVMTVHNLRLRCPNGLMFTEGETCRRCESGRYVNAVVHRCFATRTQAASYASVLWLHRFVMRLEERISRFVVPSDFMRRRVLEWGIPPDRVRLVRHFVRPSSREGADAGSGSYGLFVGRVSAEKGLDVLLRALLRAGDPAFLIVGDGPSRAALGRLAHQLGITNTRFLGWRSQVEVDELVRAARFVAIPSLSEESASLSALEALRAARPLLVSDRGALPELISTGAGLSVRAGDENDLAEKITQLVHDEQLCRRASAEAARLAGEIVTEDRHMRDLAAVYEELASSR